MNQKSAKREVVKIRDRILQVCSHGECELNRIWDYPTCWKHLTTSEKAELRERLANAVRSKEDLTKLILTGADLSGFDFTGVNLSEVFFNSCNLSKCIFLDANLTKAFLGGANLERADLTRAKMSGTVFSNAKLKNVKLLAYSIRHGKPPVNISMDCFGEKEIFKRPQIDEKEPYFATATYQSLKNYFLLNGQYDDAGWASYCERLMQQKMLWKRGKYLNWFFSLLFNFACGYGEKPSRVLFLVVIILSIYAFVFKWFGLIMQAQTPNPISWLDSLYFSAATFCTLTFADIVPINSSIAKLIVVSEAFWGILALGLFIFTLTKKYVAR